MKALQFTIPVFHDKTVIIENYQSKFFYSNLHRHEEIQLMWILKGEGTLIADCNMHTFTDNDIFLLGANQPHVFKSDKEYFSSENEKFVEGVSVFFNPDGPLGSLFQLPELSSLQSFFRNHQGGFKVPIEESGAVSSRILQLRDSEGMDQMVHFIALLKELYTLGRNLDPLSRQTTINYSEKKGKRIGQIYDFILKNYQNNLSLEDVAEYSCLTNQAFCRYFKKHTGKTFVSFLNELRIHEACKKLATEEGVQISYVAYESGFNSITNFNRVFKSIMRVSPKEYQKKLKQKVSN